jgi:hypothetical protein
VHALPGGGGGQENSARGLDGTSLGHISAIVAHAVLCCEHAVVCHGRTWLQGGGMCVNNCCDELNCAVLCCVVAAERYMEVDIDVTTCRTAGFIVQVRMRVISAAASKVSSEVRVSDRHCCVSDGACRKQPGQQGSRVHCARVDPM